MQCRLFAEQAEVQHSRIREVVEGGCTLASVTPQQLTVSHADAGAEDGRNAHAGADRLAREFGDGRVQLWVSLALTSFPANGATRNEHRRRRGRSPPPSLHGEQAKHSHSGHRSEGRMPRPRTSAASWGQLITCTGQLTRGKTPRCESPLGRGRAGGAASV